jgi:aminopeptidase N
MRHADPLQRRQDALAAVGGGEAAIGERQLDVLRHGEIADQVEALEDEADPAIADPRALDRGE